MIIIYIDIVLLVILLCLTIFACGYCFYRVHRLQQTGQMAIFLRPRKVLFSHRKEGDENDELRTVVAYQNPFTGNYCVRKSRSGSKGYVNALQSCDAPESPDSGVSDEYEPLRLEAASPAGPRGLPDDMVSEAPVELFNGTVEIGDQTKPPINPPHDENSLNKTWNWNYKEYQI